MTEFDTPSKQIQFVWRFLIALIAYYKHLGWVLSQHTMSLHLLRLCE
jgi:tryptophan-rich sensory protein